MPIQSFRVPPMNFAEWDRFFRGIAVLPDPNSVGTEALQADAVNNENIRDSAALSVIGRSANTSGDPADIAASANDTLLRRVGDALSFGALTIAMAADKLWTYAKLQDATARSVLGRSGATAGALADIAASADGQFLARRAGALAFDTLVDADIPASIARDSEVTTAISSHEAAANPHPAYLTQAEGDALYQAINAALGFIFRGSGTPEGVVTAAVGSLYLRSDGGAGTSLYVKESGTGNTGWIGK